MPIRFLRAAIPIRSAGTALVIASIAADRKRCLPIELRLDKPAVSSEKKGSRVRTSTQSDRHYAIRTRIQSKSSSSRAHRAAAITVVVFAAVVVSAFASSRASAGAPGTEEADIVGAIEVDAPAPAVPERRMPTQPVPSEKPLPKTRNMPTSARLDPAARLLSGADASEYWTLYIELESGHRITQQFLLSNAGPGDHSAVAIGHLSEPGRAPYRYENGRMRARWTLSEDQLFFDIAASHLDLHRPTGELRITKDDIEIRLFFAFAENALAARVPVDQLPMNYHVDLLAIAAETHGTIQAPWMSEPLETRGRTWLTHTWTPQDEATLLDRRVEIFGYENGTSFYGLQIQRGNQFQRAWMITSLGRLKIVESSIKIPAGWVETESAQGGGETLSYPLPGRFDFSNRSDSGQITRGREWLRFDPLAVIPQPFRWFIRRKTKPRQVWADALIRVTLSTTPGPPSLPDAGETKSDWNSNREPEEETAERSVAGVASITFLNPSERR